MKVLTSTGHWEYARLIYRTPIHWVVRDANGHRYTVTNPHRRTP